MIRLREKIHRLDSAQRIAVVAQLPTPLTTVHSPRATMWAVVVERLLAAIGGGAVDGAVLPVSLVVRSSTAAPAH